jgi:transglutaminase-like putative cysteine protease/predicted glutamine amidotransferase
VSELLALSFDADASPSITLKELAHGRGERELPYGWGFGWYPRGELAAVVIKDPTSTGDDPMTGLLRDWERFRASLFLCHIRGAAKRIAQRDAQPFIKSYAARHWLFAHSGDLEASYREAFPLPAGGPFEPLGATDSEHVFCWMLTELMARKARSLSELSWAVLHGWLRRMSEIGFANVLLADGQDLVVYRCARAQAGLHWQRRRPPHAVTRLESESLDLDLGDPLDHGRSVLIVSSSPLGGGAWHELEHGEMLVARRGEVRWQSGAAARPSAALGPRMVVPPEGTQPESRVLRVRHETAYRYAEPVERSAHRFRLRPLQDARQELLGFELQVSVDGLQRDFEDVFGNATTALEIAEPFEELVIRSRARVRVRREDPLHLRSPVQHDSIPLVWMPWQRQMMMSYLLPPELPESELRELSDYAMGFVERNDYDLLETLLDMNQTLYRDYEYVSGSTTLATTPYQIYEARRGVCQDFANLLICMARLLSVPARYRMGYIYTGGGYENRIQSDASHAWVEIYLPWVGWHGLDPTNGCQVNLDHVRVACGRNYRDATPTAGVLYKGGGTETLETRVEVESEEGPAGA